MNSPAELILDVYRGKGESLGTVEYIIHETDDFRIIAIGGSDGTLDWIQNFRAFPWHSKALGWCHSGFLKGIRPLWKLLRSRLADGKPTLVCGHSKGGGEATILAAFMCADGHPPDELLTFGSPRCAYSGLSDILAITDSTRYVNEHDPVPSVPWAIFGYRHHVDKTQLLGNGHSMSEYRDALED